MTLAQFRSSPVRTERIRELLTSDPTFQEAVVALTDAQSAFDVPRHADPVESVRALSYLAGYREAVMDLISLSTTPPEAPAEQPATWGTTPETIV